eukprot:GHVN01045737.1.p1 GENE.GHVN01045737.1~~GHVN01045737.1.p1  ORF type:complete len:277 (+),score=5.78 GHVN01045737.1:97-927(+)
MLKNFLTAFSFLLSSRSVTANPSSAIRGARDKFEALSRKLTTAPPCYPLPPMDCLSSRPFEYGLTPGQTIIVNGAIEPMTEWTTTCEGIPMCEGPCPSDNEDAVQARAYVNFDCNMPTRLCFLIVATPGSALSDRNIGDSSVGFAGDGSIQEQCFLRSPGCAGQIISTLNFDLQVISTTVINLDSTTTCDNSCTSDADCVNTPPPEDMGNSCYIGYVCDSNACVPSYSAPGRVCGEAELCRKKRCQRGNVDSRTTCEVEMSDDGTLCSNPRLRGWR